MRVGNLRRASSLALALQFFLSAPVIRATPVVGGFSPAFGRPGTQVVINGSGFSTAREVRFDTALADFSVTADTRMVATVPADATTGPIRVTNADPVPTGVTSGNFLVAPRVAGFVPARGATNTPVTIEGFNFTSTTGVLFNGVATAAFTVTAPMRIEATVPGGATNGPITVQTTAGSATTTNSFVVTGPGPIIDGFSPGVGGPGANIIIEGANFRNPVTVKFNGVTDPTAVATTAAHISANVPAAATTGKISVTTSGGTMSSSNDFIVTRAPVVTNFFPGRGQTNFTQVTIGGINFTNITGAGFNGRPVNYIDISQTAQNQISVLVPPGATTGRITVTNSFGFGTSSTDFIITSAPIIDSFSPIVGKPGDPITINGFNLSNGPTVLKFNGASAGFVVTGQGGTVIQATVPAGATTGPIRMTNAYGSFTTSSNFFVAGSAPYLSGLSPASGPRGATILITGGNFANPVTVKFNGVSSANATATALTQIQATVPANATTGPLTVTTTNGTSTNNLVFYLPPRLAGFSPTNGVVGGNVVITGANFTGANGVLFIAAADFTVTASNRISAVIPTNAMTGPLTVTTPGGVIISTNNFRVQPNITGFTPALGPVGTVVTIFGTSFFNVTNVSFNTTTAMNFTVVSSTEIRATVPPNAGTGPIRVSTPDGTAAGAVNFTVTRSSDLAISMTASATLLQPGQSLTYALVVTNQGPSIVTGVAVTDTLPAGVNFVSANSTLGSCAQTNGVVTCNIGVLTNHTGFGVSIVVVPPVEAILNNTARVTSVETDPAPGNNIASVLTPVLLDASRTLRIDLLAGGEHVLISWPASVIPFTLQFLNFLSASNSWLPVTNVPVVINARNTVTNYVSGGNRYYRLQGP